MSDCENVSEHNISEDSDDISETDMHVGHWADLCTEWLKEILL